jgi:hypothetical protein
MIPLLIDFGLSYSTIQGSKIPNSEETEDILRPATFVLRLRLDALLFDILAD